MTNGGVSSAVAMLPGARSPVQARRVRHRIPAFTTGCEDHKQQLLLLSIAEKRRTLASHFLSPDTSNKSGVRSGVIRLGCWYDHYSDESGFTHMLRDILTSRASSFVGKKILDLTATTGTTAIMLLDILYQRYGCLPDLTTLVSNEPAEGLLDITAIRIRAITSHMRLPDSRVPIVGDAMNRSGTYDAILVVGSIHFATDEERMALATMAYGKLSSGGTLTVIDRIPWKFPYNEQPTDISLAVESVRTPFDVDTFVSGVRREWEKFKGGAVTIMMDRRPTPENHGSTITALTFVK